MAGRNDGLDAVRLLGAVLVFAGHAAYRTTEDLGHPLVPLGGIGIAVFFVLSGYLIPKVYEPGTRYWARRIARVFPGYWFAVAGLGVLLGFVPSLADLTMIQAIDPQSGTISPSLNVIAVAWTLRVELLFYALVPLFVRAPALALIGGSAASWLVAQLPWSADLSMFPALHLWRFLPGLLLARWTPRPLPLTLWPLGVALLLLELVRPSGGVIAMVGGSALVASAVSRPMHVPRWVVFGAAISYGIFLWHQQLLFLLRELEPPAMVTVAAITTVVVATLSWYLVERPANRWAARHGRRPAAGIS